MNLVYETGGKQVKILLYKFSVQSALGDFFIPYHTKLHGNLTPEQLAALTDNVGGMDYADLDIPSDVVSQYLGYRAPQRMPHDSWFARKLPVDVYADNAAVKVDTSGSDFIALYQFYSVIENYDSKLLKCNWKNALSDNFVKEMSGLMSTKRTELIAALRSAYSTVSSAKTLDEISTVVQRFDLSPFVQFRSHRTAVNDMHNQITMVISADPSLVNSQVGASSSSVPKSSASYGLSQDTTTDLPVIAENDIVEVRVRYYKVDAVRGVSNKSAAVTKPDFSLQEGAYMDPQGFTRVYRGYVSNVKRTKKPGTVESVEVTCAGLSKMFSTFSCSVKPSLRENAELYAVGSELNGAQATVAENIYSGKTAKNVLDDLMGTVLLSGDAAASFSEAANYYSYFYDSNSLPGASSDYAPSTELDVNFYVPLTADQVLPDASSTSNNNPDKPSKDSAYGTDTNLQRKFGFQVMSYIATLAQFSDTYAQLEWAAANTDLPKDIQLMSRIYGTLERGSLPAFNIMLSKMPMWFSDMKHPVEILSQLRQSMYMEIFEDRPGTVRIRPPKYNVINVNPVVSDFGSALESSLYYLPVYDATGTKSAEIPLCGDYIIPVEDILDLTFERNDNQLITRSDSTLTEPIVGSLTDITSWFTDVPLLLKYGLRTSGSSSNPLCRSFGLARVASALHTATANSGVRTLRLQVKDKREYRVGRLYFIPMDSSSEDFYSNGIACRGVIGYVTSITNEERPGAAPTHQIEMTCVRRAEIVHVTSANYAQYDAYYVNFKHLPDIDSFMANLVTDTKALEAVNTAAKNFIKTPLASPNLGATTAVRRCVIANADGNDKFSPQSDSGRFISSIFSTSNTSAICPEFLAQLTLLDIDPNHALYPTTAYTPTAFQALRIGVSTADYKNIPVINTHSVKYRDMRDLVALVHALVRTAIVARVQQISSSKAYSATSAAASPYMLAPDLSNLGYAGFLPKGTTSGVTYTLSESITIGNDTYTITTKSGDTDTAKIGYYGVVCCVNSSSPNLTNRLFYLPIINNHSTRLCEILGYPDIQCTGSTDVNMHMAGHVIPATDVGVCTWTLQDVVENLIELYVRNSGQTESGLVNDTSTLMSLYQAYANASINPYVVAEGGTFYAVSPASALYTTDATAQIERGQMYALETAVDLMGASPGATVGGVAQGVDARTKTYSLLYNLQFCLATATNDVRVFVPIHDDFYTAYFSTLLARAQLIDFGAGQTKLPVAWAIVSGTTSLSTGTTATFIPVQGGTVSSPALTTTCPESQRAAVTARLYRPLTVPAWSYLGPTYKGTLPGLFTVLTPAAGYRPHILSFVDPLQFITASDKTFSQGQLTPLTYLWFHWYTTKNGALYNLGAFNNATDSGITAYNTLNLKRVTDAG